MTPAPVTLAELRGVDLFDDLDDEELADWVPAVEPVDYEAGVQIVEQGEDAPGVLLLLEGRVETLLAQGGHTQPVGHQLAPTWIFAIAVLTEGPAGVRTVTETPCRVGIVPPEKFRKLAFDHPAVHRKVMQQVAPVMSRLSSIEQNRERLASLGTMAAGLAHELNNPAAAARRAATSMTEAVEVVSASLGRFVEAGIEREEAAGLIKLQMDALAGAASQTALGSLDAADAEDELLDALEDIGVPEPWKVVEPLSAAGVDREWLGNVEALAGPATDSAVAWVAATLTIQGLAAELRESTERMSSLLGAVKDYTYVDRGGMVEVDIHEGLKATLTILGHKLKHTQIEVRRDYDQNLPKVTVRGQELNQVWTNLLDNAIDALGDSGTITITTGCEPGNVFVEIADDGPGVPPEHQERIFDQFFTTKDVGHGTGLGLATARQIIVDGHDGSLSLESAPGRTAFRVRLPAPTP